MDNFKIIYRILRIFEKAMDYRKFDLNSISAEALGISEERRLKILKMLSDNGYIEGITIDISADGYYMMSVFSPAITLPGLEYLEENSLMRKVKETIIEGIDIASRAL